MTDEKSDIAKELEVLVCFVLLVLCISQIDLQYDIDQ